MMKLTFGAFLVASLISITSHANAAFQTGNTLLSACSIDQFPDKAVCLGYVLGVSDEYEALRAGEHKAACIPAGVAASQMIDVVRVYLQTNPAIRHWNASVLVVAAFQAAWSCKL